MKYLVKTSKQAKAEFSYLLEFIVARSPRGANAWASAFNKAILALEEFPFRCPIAPENEESEIEIRHLLFKTQGGEIYRALFTVEESVVVILHIRGGKQQNLSAEELH